MAKTKRELIEKELEDVDEILDTQFLEQEIALYLEDKETADLFRTQIDNFMKRKEALQFILEHLSDSEFMDFAAIIQINR